MADMLAQRPRILVSPDRLRAAMLLNAARRMNSTEVALPECPDQSASGSLGREPARHPSGGAYSLSRRVDVSERTLQLAFAEHSGMSPHQYLVARRLNHARQLLLKSARMNSPFARPLQRSASGISGGLQASVTVSLPNCPPRLSSEHALAQ